MLPKEENPWDIESIYVMQYFVCPSCTYKHISKQDFVCHAFDNHPESVNYLKNISDDSFNDILCPWDSNDFKTEEIDENIDLNDHKIETSDNLNEIVMSPLNDSSKYSKENDYNIENTAEDNLEDPLEIPKSQQ